ALAAESSGRRASAPSGYWLSTRTAPSRVLSQPIVPPRKVKYPTLRRISRNTGTCASAGSVARNAAGSLPPAHAATDCMRNSRRVQFIGDILDRRVSGRSRFADRIRICRGPTGGGSARSGQGPVLHDTEQGSSQDARNG